jgi:hypothetical protein
MLIGIILFVVGFLFLPEMSPKKWQNWVGIFLVGIGSSLLLQ